MGATTDTCADMSWVLGDECGTVVRGLCQRPVFRLRGTGYDVRFRLRFCFGCVFGFGFGFDFLAVFLVSVPFAVMLLVARCLRSFMVHCTFLSDTSSALDTWELCCWKGD